MTQRHKLTVIRAAKTSANYKYGMGGLPKTPGRSPKAITLPKLKCLESDADGERVPQEGK